MNNFSQIGFSDQLNTPTGNIRDMVFKYLLNLPLFILCMVISLGSVNIYLRYSNKVYQANSQILVGGVGAISANNSDLVSQGLFGVRAINIDNELELLRSKKLIERVVKKGQFNIQYFNEGTIKRMELDKLSPILINYLQLIDSSNAWNLSFSQVNNKGGRYQFGKTIAGNYKWGDTLRLPVAKIVIKKRYKQMTDNGQAHTIEWTSIQAAANEIRNGLSVKSFSTRTTIISLSILSANPSRAADILNLLGYEFAEQDVELKREISINTLNFIEDRLRVVSEDMRRIDSNRTGLNGNARVNCRMSSRDITVSSVNRE